MNAEFLIQTLLWVVVLLQQSICLAMGIMIAVGVKIHQFEPQQAEPVENQLRRDSN